MSVSRCGVLVGGFKPEDIQKEYLARKRLEDQRAEVEERRRALQEKSGVKGAGVDAGVKPAAAFFGDQWITLPGGIVVSRGSTGSLSPVGAVEFAAALNQALQTGDLSVIVRDEIDKNPLVVGGNPSLDGSDLYQRLSDVALFYKGRNGVWLAVSDLPRMYGRDWGKQLEAAKRIGWGAELPMDDECVVRLLDTAGGRKVKLPESHWPYEASSASLGKDKVALTVFPQEAGRLGVYLFRKRRGECRFYLLNPSVPVCLEDNKTGVVRPLGLGGNDYGNIDSVGADGYYGNSGRARSGSVVAPKNSQ